MTRSSTVSLFELFLIFYITVHSVILPSQQCCALPGGHVVDTLRDDIAAALDLQQDGRRVGQLLPVRQRGEAARTHHPVQLSLHGIISDR